MEQNKIPKPEFNLNYQFKTIEDFTNLRVIDVLWILSMDSYTLALNGIKLKYEKYNHAIEIGEDERLKTKEEVQDWINSYIRKDNPYWLCLKKNYGQNIKTFLNEIALLFEMSGQNSTIINGVDSDTDSFIRKIVYSGFYKSIRKGQWPTLLQSLFFFIMLESQFKTKKTGKSSHPYFLRDYLSLMFTIIKRDQQEFIPKLRTLVNSAFSVILFEIYTHYLLNYMYQAGEINTFFRNEKLIIQESLPSIPSSLETSTIAKVGITQSQLVLVYYYFFKQYGLEPRKDINISPLARFIHLTTDTTFTKIQNSDIYSKLQKAPNFKTDKELIKDLKIIKELFKEHEFHDISKDIDNEILIASNTNNKK